MSIHGWRWWDIGKDGSLLSVNNLVWPPDEELKAECEFGNAGSHPAITVPDFDCHCGFWAFWDPEIASGLPHLTSYFRTTKAFGLIEGWGGIVEHENGFRCQYAVPRAIVVFRGRLHPAYTQIARYRRIDDMLQTWDVNDQTL